MQNHGSNSKSFRLLYVDDNPTDIHLVQYAPKDFQPLVDLTAMGTGDKGLSYLRRNNPFEAALRPHLILLDLNLPGLRGEQGSNAN